MMERVVDVALRQGCLQRCFDIGDLCITFYAGEDGDDKLREVLVHDLPNIMFVYDAVSQTINSGERLRSNLNGNGKLHDTTVGSGAMQRQSGVQGKKHLI